MDDSLETLLSRTMPGDRFRFRRQLRRLAGEKLPAMRGDNRLDQLRESMLASAELLQYRRDHIPLCTYDPELPIVAHREAIIEVVQRFPVTIVCGDTGSGKSTQLPKICLDAGRGVTGVIGHTQPRRIAARSVASRLAAELQTPLGQAVGYKIRFNDRTQPRTYVKLMTDGILLAETQQDRFLNRYDTLIIDEAHERSLNIDFLLGYLHRLLHRRDDLRVIITSATIDVERYSEHFSFGGQAAPIIEVSGRMYPVEVRYLPLAEVDEEATTALPAAVDELLAAVPGDLLVFLPTERDIREAAKVLRGHLTGTDRRNIEILPLYARLSSKEQDRVFAAHRGRRIVLATNVAESSLTVPGIRGVIDSGTARISRYSPRSKVQRLPIEAVSQASADQRKGRCGRLGPGVCVRLYSEDDFLARNLYDT